MTYYEKHLIDAQNQDKVVYYDYLLYKRAAGWWTGLINDDWNRPTKIEKARYNAEFLQNIPNYYFLRVPIRELIKSDSSGGYCHACAVALSLCFKDFEIMTCNLKSYNDYYHTKVKSLDKEFEHTVLVVDIEGKKTVIDTTWGFITDLETYKDIFCINNVRIISSDEIKNTEIYKFIESRKLIKCPSYDEYIRDTEDYQKYSKEIHKYMDMCKNYKNNNNAHLRDFFNRCLYKTSNSSCVWNWRSDLHFKTCNRRFIYPENNMYSLVDDEKDENLYSEYKDTIERNRRVLENYHKEIEEPKPQSKLNALKNKVLKLTRVFGIN